MAKQYISSCGMVSVNEVERTFEQIGTSAQEHAVFGVQISPITLLGKLNRRGPHWYPEGSEYLGYLFSETRGRIKELGGLAIHVNFDSTMPEHVKSMVDLVQRVVGCKELEDQIDTYFQLNNLDWLHYDWSNTILKIQKAGHKVILQASLPICASNPETIRRACEVQNPDYVLLDTSGGNGYPFVVDTYAEIIESLSAIGVGIGVAGGLGPDELHRLAWLAERFDGLSCDAETKLRDRYHPHFPERSRFSPDKASQYINQASSILGIT